ncbi:glucosamine-6-phosphate deaminase [Breznakia pachnodae]|uniref:6-phosphogluconolactonase/glucosamine-6-phosphate isomerase/deaminase n=1 Tax=Breznakia pachnodae TaxID=265178 RepID=A0ABU0E343_9FIRM|nr:glucosamine-6-phosphate deaminase [Breznakia pachnodae]MDQ0361118.1 6-phosphogluconolactonase/glucosamine-6-phosphate isomerase/deaminase [Breznakia pachnodae]
MKKIIVDTYDELSDLMNSIIVAEMTKDKKSNISITAGASPKGVYERLVKFYKKYSKDVKNTYFYNFDEVPAMNPNEEGMTLSSLREQFYTPANVEEENIVKLNLDNYDTYDQIIEDNGGLDLMMIGLGADGHFCGNMPMGTDFSQYTYRMYIKEEYPWYAPIKEQYGDNEVPEYFVTMGLKSLLKVKHLVLIVNGTSKAEALKKMLTLDMTNEFPATGLLLHPNFTIIADKEAAALL